MRAALLVILALIGCDDEPAFVRYEIPHRPSVDCAPVETAGECARDLDCASTMICGRDPSVAPTDLVSVTLACQSPGLGGGPGTACTDGRGCAHGLCVAAGSCVAPCADARDCGVGQRCAALWVRSAEEAFERARGCVDVVTAPANVTVVRSAIDAVEWSRGRTTLLFGGGARQVVIVPSCGAEALATSLATRANPPALRFDYGTATAGASQRTWIEESASPIGLLVPNGGAPAPAEGLTLELQTEGEGGAEVIELSRTTPGTNVDVDLFYVGGGGWAPEGTRGPREVAAAIDYLDSRLAEMGLAVGEVRQHAITGGLRARFAVLSTGLRPSEEDERGALFALSAGARGPSLPIFLVRTVVGALGRSGGVPGPAGVHGTTGSGIVLGPDLVSSNSTFQRALAHESLHYLGLFHTTEATGVVKDTIDDTPVCPLERDTDGDGILSAEECAGAGGDNLMFWALEGEALSAGQAAVVGAGYVGL